MEFTVEWSTLSESSHCTYTQRISIPTSYKVGTFFVCTNMSKWAAWLHVDSPRRRGSGPRVFSSSSDPPTTRVYRMLFSSMREIVSRYTREKTWVLHIRKNAHWILANQNNAGCMCYEKNMGVLHVVRKNVGQAEQRRVQVSVPVCSLAHNLAWVSL